MLVVRGKHMETLYVGLIKEAADFAYGPKNDAPLAQRVNEVIATNEFHITANKVIPVDENRNKYIIGRKTYVEDVQAIKRTKNSL